MDCPMCAEEDRASRVEGGDVWEVAGMHCLSFTDEAGKWHHHDGTTKRASYACSNGHRWLVALHQTCWCGWSARGTLIARRADARGTPLPLPAGAPARDHELTWTPL